MPKYNQELTDGQWWSGNYLWGNANWANTFVILGAPEAGKSFKVMDMFLHFYRRHNTPFFWVRLSDTARDKLLKDNAAKLIDTPLRKKYNIGELFRKGDTVYEVIKRAKQNKNGTKGAILEKRLICTVYSCASVYNDKGVANYDPKFIDKYKRYNICFDEMNREHGERDTFDLVSAFKRILENVMRSTQKNLIANHVNAMIVAIGNYTSETSEFMSQWNFQPPAGKFGVYKLRRKGVIIDYIEPSDAYKERRSKSIVSDFGNDNFQYDNKIDIDQTNVVKKHKYIKPNYNIKFNNRLSFTVWDNYIIRMATPDTLCERNLDVFPMTPYLEQASFDINRKNMIIDKVNRNFYSFDNESTKVMFYAAMQIVRPNKT